MPTFSNTWFSKGARGRKCAKDIWTEHLLPRADSIDLYLELGVAEGQSFLWVLDNLKPSFAVGVDSYKAPDHHDQSAYHKHRDNLLENLSEWCRRDPLNLGNGSTYSFEVATVNIVIAICDTAEWLASSFLPCDRDPSFDLIYVDAGHLAWECITDIALAWRLLKKGGIMVIDDLNRVHGKRGNPEVWFAVQAFQWCWKGRWQRLFEEGRQIGFVKRK